MNAKFYLFSYGWRISLKTCCAAFATMIFAVMVQAQQHPRQSVVNRPRGASLAAMPAPLHWGVSMARQTIQVLSAAVDAEVEGRCERLAAISAQRGRTLQILQAATNQDQVYKDLNTLVKQALASSSPERDDPDMHVFAMAFPEIITRNDAAMAYASEALVQLDRLLSTSVSRYPWCFHNAGSSSQVRVEAQELERHEDVEHTSGLEIL